VSSSVGPKLDVQQHGVAQGDGPWLVAFDVTNHDESPVEIIEAWLPHARFHAEAQDVSDSRPLAPGRAMHIGFTAEFDEPVGTEAPNAFVILRVRWQGEEWRVLARLTVTSGERAEPAARTELITAHRVGFAK
jgi:hypothetical protein